MNSVANQKVRLSDSTTSSDSGVLIDDTASLHKDGVVGNIKVTTTITDNNHTDLQDNINNKCNLSRSSSFCSITSSIILNNRNDSNNNQHCHNYTKARDFVEAKNSPDSLRSNNISIISIDEDDDSSVIDSDSDIENFASRGDLVVQKLGQQTSGSQDGMIVISNSAEGSSSCEVISPSSSNASRPNIGSIAVQNSTDITFGNKTFYQGPVTIKQFMLENNKWKAKDGSPMDNPAYDSNDGSPNFCEETKKAPDSSDPRRKFNLDKRTIVIIVVILLLFLLIGAVVITSLTLIKSKGYNKPGKALRMVTRSEWIAQPPNDVLDDLELPVNRIIITHTASDNCTTQAACVFHVRFIQTFHMESRHWDDIGYNFLVGGDGAAYEGRGWDKVGAHTKGFNVGSLGIAFIGTFTKYAPPARQLQVAQLLIQEGVKIGKVSPNYKLYGHRQLIPSESPGEKLYEIIKTWPHWTDNVD